MNVKKTVSCLLAASLCLAYSACGGGNVVTNDPDTPSPSIDEPSEAQPSGAEDTAPEQGFTLDLENAPVGGQVIVGAITAFNKDFMSGWGNNAADANIKSLLSGYQIITGDRDGNIFDNPVVVKEHQVTENEDGSHTHTYQIAENLVYSDGTPITAKDYVFNILMTSSPEFAALEADATSGADCIGFEAFNSGESENFSGVHLIGDYAFSITISKESLPTYWESFYAGFSSPYPMHVMAPGVEVIEEEAGARLSDAFTADLLRETLIGANNDGYRYRPSVVAGPYTFVSFDDASNQATLQRNDKFLGTYDGVKPHIDKIIVKAVSPDTSMDELKSGSIDLLCDVSQAEKVDSGLDAVDAGTLAYCDYPNNGYSKIEMVCDFGPTQFVAVRQALMYCTNREEYIRQFYGGYGAIVNGFYSPAQMEYQQQADKFESELINYEFDTEKAKQLLIEDGWTKNASGNDFTEGTDDIRYKEVDGELMPLSLQIAASEGASFNIMNTLLPPEAAKAGMKVEFTTMDFAVLLNNLYRQGIDKPVYNAFLLSNGFASINSPWLYFGTDESYFGAYNTTRISDPELNDAAMAMKNVNYSDKESWSQKYFEFNKVWNQKLPEIPLAAGQIHDFYYPKIKNYESSSLWPWDSAILYAYVEQ